MAPFYFTGFFDVNLKNFFSFTVFYFLFICFWLYWVFVALRRLSVVAASRGSLHCSAWLLLVVASHYRAQGLGSLASLVGHRLSSCGSWP